MPPRRAGSHSSAVGFTVCLNKLQHFQGIWAANQCLCCTELEQVQANKTLELEVRAAQSESRLSQSLMGFLQIYIC